MNEIVEPKRIDDIEQLSDKFKPLAKQLLGELSILKYPLAPYETLRTAERQKYLFDKKVSNCDGYIKKGKHQSGNAIDLVPCLNGFFWTEPKYNMLLGKIVQDRYPLVKWGWEIITPNGDRDIWHYELRKI